MALGKFQCVMALFCHVPTMAWLTYDVSRMRGAGGTSSLNHHGYTKMKWSSHQTFPVSNTVGICARVASIIMVACEKVKQAEPNCVK